MIKDKVFKLIDNKEPIFLKLDDGLNRISRTEARNQERNMREVFRDSLPQGKVIELLEERDYVVSPELEQQLVDYLSPQDYVKRNYSTRSLRSYVNDYLHYQNLPYTSGFKIYFTREFNWTPGDYGDNGSCYWQSKASAKDMIIKEKGFAIQFHNERNQRIGRCWGTFLEGGYSEPTLLIFNAYNNLGYGNCLDWFADILYRALGYKDYHRVQLQNNGGGGQNILFINKNTGILLHSTTGMKDGFRIDLKWKEIKTVVCSGCRQGFLEENCTYVEDRMFCGPCLTRNAFICFGCMELRLTRDCNNFVDGETTTSYCYNCFGKLFAVCRQDQKIYKKSDMVIIDYGDYCAKCNLDKITHSVCSRCNNLNHSRRSWCHNCGEVLVKPKPPAKPRTSRSSKAVRKTEAQYLNRIKDMAQLFSEEEGGELF